jgi:hypothetical protein
MIRPGALGPKPELTRRPLWALSLVGPLARAGCGPLEFPGARAASLRDL